MNWFNLTPAPEDIVPKLQPVAHCTISSAPFSMPLPMAGFKPALNPKD